MNIALIGALLQLVGEWLSRGNAQAALGIAMEQVQAVAAQFPASTQNVNRRVAATARLQEAVPGLAEHQAGLLVELALLAVKHPEALAEIAARPMNEAAGTAVPPVSVPPALPEDAVPVPTPDPGNAPPADEPPADAEPTAEPQTDTPAPVDLPADQATDPAPDPVAF